MSLGTGLDRLQEVFMLALMLIFFIAVGYSRIELMYKIVISLLVLSLTFLVMLFAQIFQQKETKF